MGKAAFSFWSLGLSRLLPDQSCALRELDQRRSAKNSRISSAPSEKSDENQGRVSAPLRSFAENRSATPGGGGGGGGVGVPFSLILSLSPRLLSHSFFLTLFFFLFISRERLTCHRDAKQRIKLDRLPNVFPIGSVIIRLRSRGHAQRGRDAAGRRFAP